MEDRLRTTGSSSEPPQGDKRAALYFDDVHAPIGALSRIRVNSAPLPPSLSKERLRWHRLRHANEPSHEPRPQRARLRCLTRSAAGVIALGSLFKKVRNNLSG